MPHGRETISHLEWIKTIGISRNARMMIPDNQGILRLIFQTNGRTWQSAPTVAARNSEKQYPKYHALWNNSVSGHFLH